MLAWMALMGLANAETVAHVLIVDGPAYFDTKGNEVAAAVGQDIDSESTLIVEDGTLLFLLLQNGRVVSFADEIELPVNRISALSAAPSTASVQDQLNQLMKPDDRARLGSMVQAAESIGGWHGRVTAVKDPTRGGPAGESDDESPEEVMLEKSAERSLSTEGTSEGPVPGLADHLASFQPGGAQARCVAKWSKKAVGKKAEQVDVMVKTDADGKITAGFTSDGVALPPCVIDSLLGKPVSDLEAPLKLK